MLLTACGAPARASSDDPSSETLNVVATTSIVADLVRGVGGSQVEVTSLMGPGVDPHLYKASAGDVSRLQEADLIFYNGLHLEAGMATVLERMSSSGQTIAVTDGLDPTRLNAPENFAGAYDPHVWFDAELWSQTVVTVEAALIAADPEHADQYHQNAEAYRAQLLEVDEYARQQIASIPEGQRVLITAHDAFGYFGQAYNIEVIGLQGISTATEASTADVERLVDLIESRQIPAIFIESSVPQRNIEAVQAAVEARGYAVVIGGELFSDALGDLDSEAGTYAGMFRSNVDTITAALSQP